MEVGPREKERGEFVLVSRLDKNHRVTVAKGDVKVKVQEMLDLIHQELFRRCFCDLLRNSFFGR